jgi:hypothetical protein
LKHAGSSIAPGFASPREAHQAQATANKLIALEGATISVKEKLLMDGSDEVADQRAGLHSRKPADMWISHAPEVWADYAHVVEGAAWHRDYVALAVE